VKAATATGAAHDPVAFFVVFGVFVLLCVVLVFFVARFAVKLNRGRTAGNLRRPRR
jgi:hypothetical protein